MVPEQSGIYEIVHVASGRRYTGSAVNLKIRWKLHQWHLNHDVHHSAKLQRAWNKYGAEAFTFKVVLLCDHAHLLMYEQTAIDFKSEFNILRVAGSRLGSKMTPEQREKMSRSRQEFLATQEGTALRRRYSDLMRARVADPAVKDRIRAARRTDASREVSRRVALETFSRPEVQAKAAAQRKVLKGPVRSSAIQMLRDGLSCREVGRRLGMSHGPVCILRAEMENHNG